MREDQSGAPTAGSVVRRGIPEEVIFRMSTEGEQEPAFIQSMGFDLVSPSSYRSDLPLPPPVPSTPLSVDYPRDGHLL